MHKNEYFRNYECLVRFKKVNHLLKFFFFNNSIFLKYYEVVNKICYGVSLYGLES